MMDAAADSLSEGFLLVRGHALWNDCASLTSFISGGTRDQTFKTERPPSARVEPGKHLASFAVTVTNLNYGRVPDTKPAKLGQAQRACGPRGPAGA